MRVNLNALNIVYGTKYYILLANLLQNSGPAHYSNIPPHRTLISYETHKTSTTNLKKKFKKKYQIF